MKINCNYNQSFGSEKLYKAKLKQKVFWLFSKDVDVFITELKPSDAKTFIKHPSIMENTHYGRKIVHNFLDSIEYPDLPSSKGKKYFAIEDPKQPAKKRFKGLCIAENVLGHVYISKLQSQSEIPTDKKLKGAGSCLIYAVTKYAKEHKRESVSLFSDPKAIKFYKKLGFTPTTTFKSDFVLPYSEFNLVTKPIEKKFDIKEV